MNPADVLLSGEYPALSPLPYGDDESSPVRATGGPPAASPITLDVAELTPEKIAQILVSVNTSLGINLGDLDYAQFIVLDSQEEDDSKRPRDGGGKREYSHIQLVCEACGHIIIAVAKAVSQAIIEAGDDSEARSSLPKRKRGGILGFKELAAKAKLSPWHFHRVFRSITDVTPKAYGEACWDFLLRSHGFNVEPRSPVIGEKTLPVPMSTGASRGGPGRIGKSASRSRSRSRPRHPSQTQSQVMTALTGTTEEVRRRSRSAARSSSFSSRLLDFNPEFTPATDFGADFSPEMAATLQTPTMIPPTSARTRRNSTPLLQGQQPQLSQPQQQPQLSQPQQQQQQLSQPPQQQLPAHMRPMHMMHAQPIMPPGTISGEYMEMPTMYENLAYAPDQFLDGPMLDPVLPTPGLDSTIESTPSTGVESGNDEVNPTHFDIPEFSTLSLSRDYDWKREDPSLAPYVREPEMATQFFAKEYEQYPEQTPEFDDLKLLETIEEPIIFKPEY